MISPCSQYLLTRLSVMRRSDDNSSLGQSTGHQPTFGQKYNILFYTRILEFLLLHNFKLFKKQTCSGSIFKNICMLPYPLSLSAGWYLQTSLVSSRQIQLDNRILLLVVIEEGTIKYNIRTPSEWKLQWMVLGRDAWVWKNRHLIKCSEPIFCWPTLPVFIFVCKFIKCFSFPEFCTARCRPYFVKILKINIGSGIIPHVLNKVVSLHLGIPGRRVHQPPPVLVRRVSGRSKT